MQTTARFLRSIAHIWDALQTISLDDQSIWQIRSGDRRLDWASRSEQRAALICASAPDRHTYLGNFASEI